MKWLYFMRFTTVLCLFLITIVGFGSNPKTIWAISGSEIPTNNSFGNTATPSQNSWFDKIETDWGGRFRTVGTVSWPDDDTIFSPVGTGTYYDGLMDLRINNLTFFSDRIYTEVNYENILSGGDTRRARNELREFFPGFPERSVLFGAPLEDDARFFDLTGTIKDGDSYIWFHRLDRLNITIQPDWGLVRVGRQAITWGNGLIFNPMDLFNPFPPTDINRDYKVGDDMITTAFDLPQIGDLQFLWVVRRNPDTDSVGAPQNSLAGKLHFAYKTTEFDVMTTKHYSDFVAGAGSSGYLADAAWRCDVTWTLLDENQNGGPDNYFTVVANMDYSWNWFKKNFYGLIEYYHNGLGRSNYSKALLDPDINERLQRGELFVVGNNYLTGELQIELHPLFRVFLTAINNIEDPSGIFQPRAVWDVTQNLQMLVGANVAYGAKGSEFGGFRIPGTDLRNKVPPSVYLWFNYYF